jgi:hypothetical protein
MVLAGSPPPYVLTVRTAIYKCYSEVSAPPPHRQANRHEHHPAHTTRPPFSGSASSRARAKFLGFFQRRAPAGRQAEPRAARLCFDMIAEADLRDYTAR